MATLLFVILKMTGVIETAVDYYWLCLLIALDTQTAFRYVLWRHGL